MATNLLDVSLKKTTRLDLHEALSTLIQDHFSQHVSEFGDDLHRLDALRNDIVEPPVGPAGLARLMKYYTQLTYLMTKLPNDIGVQFEWGNAINPQITQAQDDLSFERANVVFNIAVMYSCLGIRENRSTAAGLKRAHQQFQIAAGCFQTAQTYMSSVFFPRMEDLEDEFLSCMTSVMLAQAQECIWQRAVLDQMKDKLIAQLSQQVSKLYGDAAKSLQKSTAMSPTWVHHLTLKSLHFEAAAQFRMSSSAMSSNKYGEEVARLRVASECCRKAQQHVPYVNKIVAQDLSGLTERVLSNESRAEKDNDMIYVVPVPAPESLAPIVAQAMVKPTMIAEITDPLESVSFDDLALTKLEPFIVRNAIDIFEQRKEEIVSKEITNRFRALDLESQAVLQELGLPGSLTALEQPLGIPPTLLSQSEELRKKGGSLYLQELIEEVAALANANSELIEQIVDVIDENSMEDAEETTFGKDGSDLLSGYRNQIEQYQTFLNQAKTSDVLVRNKVAEWKDKIDLLSTDEKTLSRSIPNARRVTMSRDDENVTRRVRAGVNRLNLLYSERKKQVEELRNYADHDEIRAEVVEHARSLEKSRFGQALQADEFEGIISTHLDRYAAKTRLVDESEEAQADLLEEIRDANTAFVASRSAITSSSDRERMLQDLDTAYHKYQEIINNLEEGSKFYSDFHKALCRVSDEIKAALSKLQDRRARDEEDMLRATHELNLDGNPIVTSTKSKTAGTWSPEKGIQFGGSSSSPSTRSSVSATRTSNVFDPAKHSILFGTSKR